MKVLGTSTLAVIQNNILEGTLSAPGQRLTSIEWCYKEHTMQHLSGTPLGKALAQPGRPPAFCTSPLQKLAVASKQVEGNLFVCYQIMTLYSLC